MTPLIAIYEPSTLVIIVLVLMIIIIIMMIVAYRIWIKDSKQLLYWDMVKNLNQSRFNR